MREFFAPPKSVTGYFLDLSRSWFAIIEPEETTNLFTNPSWEKDTNGWTASSTGSGGTPYQRTLTTQFKGLYCAQLTIRPTSGTYVQIVSTTNAAAASPVTASFYVKSATKRPITSSTVKIIIDNVVLEASTIEEIGDGWWLVSQSYTPAGSNPVGIRVIGAPNQIFYVDAAQWETKAYRTTYCDGDEQGLLPVEVPVPFSWSGVAHASTSSRSFQTRAGGRPRELSDFDFNLLALEGFGMPSITTARLSIASGDGSLFQGSRKDERTVQLGGVIYGSTARQLARKRAELRVLCDPNLTGSAQPLVMEVQKFDDCGAAVTERLKVICTYDGGLEESHQSEFDEAVTISFVMDNPYFLTIREIGVLLTQPSSISVGAVTRQNFDGTWTPLGTTQNWVTTNRIIFRANGNILANSGTKVGRDWINEWNGSSWSIFQGGVDLGGVNDMTETPNGDVYITGGFTNVGSIPTAASKIARWNGSVWSALGTGFNVGSSGGCSALGPDGNVYIGGDFTTANGVAVSQITYWNGTTFVNIGNPGIAVVLDILWDAAGRLYAMGPSRVARLDGSTWTNLGNTTGGSVYRGVIGIDGKLYVTGAFLTIGGVSANKIASWNGSTWESIGSGTNGDIFTIASHPFVDFLGLYGFFTTAGGILIPDRMATLTRGTYSRPDIDLSTFASDNTFAFDSSGRTYITHPQGTAVVPQLTTFQNPYSSASRISLSITNTVASYFSSFKLFTPQAELLTDISTLVGETLNIVLSRRGFRASSNVRPSLGSGILPGSKIGSMAPVKGTNQASYLITNPATSTAFIVFQPAALSLDEARIHG